jgi:hypothetical protein
MMTVQELERLIEWLLGDAKEAEDLDAFDAWAIRLENEVLPLLQEGRELEAESHYRHSNYIDVPGPGRYLVFFRLGGK